MLVLWVFVRIVLWTLGFVSGNARVSFPFSNEGDPNLSDAPMYSVVLATCFTAYAFYSGRRRCRRVLPLLALLATVAAIILSGSRTGLIAVGAVMAAAEVGRLFTAARDGRIRLSVRAVVLVVVAGFVAGIVVVRLLATDVRGLEQLVNRMFNLDGGCDASIGSRLEKLNYAVAFSSGPRSSGWACRAPSTSGSTTSMRVFFSRPVWWDS
jgi:O-antigen ligase